MHIAHFTTTCTAVCLQQKLLYVKQKCYICLEKKITIDKKTHNLLALFGGKSVILLCNTFMHNLLTCLIIT